jgi:hypothetical protein
MFKARATRAFKFPRAIIDNYARGTYNVLLYFIIYKRFKQMFSIPERKSTKSCVHANLVRYFDIVRVTVYIMYDSL